MKKSVSLLAAIASTFALAQVGINNTSPQATLDITAKTSDGSMPEGIIAPRLTGDQIQAADARYATAQTGTLVYATAAATAPAGKTANITAAGYYFFDGSVWQRVTTGAGTNIYNANGALTANRTVAQGTSTLAFTNTATSGTSHFTVDGSTFNVDAVNNRIGVGTNTPEAALQVYDYAFDPTANLNSGLRVDGRFPGIIFSGGPTAGIWADENSNTLAFSTAGSLTSFPNVLGEMRLEEGKLGVGGTSHPSETLDITGNVKFSGALMPNNTSGTNGQVLTSAGSGNAPTWKTSTALPVNNALVSSLNTLTSTVNGTAATAPVINSISNTSSGNNLSTTVNGVAGAAVNIINNNTLSAASNVITSSVNGISATLTPAAGGTVTENLGFNASGALVRQTVTSANTPNIYTADGTVTATRSVSQGSNAIDFQSTSAHNVNFTRGDTSSGQAIISVRKTNNTNPAVNTALTSGQTIGGIMFRAANGSDWSENAMVSAVASEAQTAAAGGGELILSTKNNGASGSPVERVRINNIGNVGIGTNDPKSFLHINRTGSASGIATSFVDGITLTANSASSGFSGPGFYFESLNSPINQRLLKVNYTVNSSNEAFLNYQAVTDNGGTSVRPVMAIFHNGKVGIGTNTPAARLNVSGDGTNPPIKIDNTINQPGTGSYAYLTIDNTTGNVYKGTQASQAFYYQKYILTNVNFDWVQDFNTRIPTANYTLVIVGTSFNKGLSVADTDNTKDVFYAQNVFAYPSAGTWRISADFPIASTSDSSNGTWTIHTMILSNNQVVSNSDITVNLAGSNTGAATASPVP